MTAQSSSFAVYLLVALGGGLGAMSRYWLQLMISRANESIFPYGTLTVNILGSFLIGVLFVLISEKLVIAESWRPIIVIGFLGAMTTFSTFSLDALLLFQQGHYNTALIYTIGSVITCLLAAGFGVSITRLF